MSKYTKVPKTGFFLVLFLMVSYSLVAQGEINFETTLTLHGYNTNRMVLEWHNEMPEDEYLSPWNPIKIKKFCWFYYDPDQVDMYYHIYSRGGSVSGTDPKLWYQDTWGEDWQYLSDDQGGNRNFSAVVHFNDLLAFTVVGAGHWSSNDLDFYDIQIDRYYYDPDIHGVYYLEVYAVGEDVVWHP
ncbi:MAG: hypothetical protein QNJ97_15435 [Myxococcota bacterium]|nr:hypothetical protein [Myxococcota bacterium]